MAHAPITKEGVSAGKLVLNVEKVGLTEEQFFQLCGDNRDLRMELTARKELIIMPPAGLKSSWRNNILSTRLTNWAEKDGTGIVFDSSAGYRLPNTMRSCFPPATVLTRTQASEELSHPPFWYLTVRRTETSHPNEFSPDPTRKLTACRPSLWIRFVISCS